MTRSLRLTAAISAASFVVLLAGCHGIATDASSSTAGPVATTHTAAATTSGPAKAAAKATADPSTACENRPVTAPASGGIIVRMLVPTLGWQAQEIGGGWIWNVTEHKCLTSAQMMIATAPPEAGNCTQVAYVASNPGYDPDATPAKPLRKVIAEAGPGC